MELATRYRTILAENGIVTPLRLAHFFAQCHHESGGFIKLEENLNYSAQGLRKVFRKYFSELESIQYARRPEAIANRVYANRMGNGNEASGDGWKHRGRGLLHHTGKREYEILTEEIGVDYLNNPDLLTNEADAMVCALSYWNRKNLNYYADRDDLLTITKRINGGYNGIAERRKLLDKYKEIFIPCTT